MIFTSMIVSSFRARWNEHNMAFYLLRQANIPPSFGLLFIESKTQENHHYSCTSIGEHKKLWF